MNQLERLEDNAQTLRNRNTWIDNYKHIVNDPK